MFESICIRRQQKTGTPIDLGLLAEAMVFYQHVHVVADSGVFSYLLRVCGPDSLIASLEHGFLKLSYLENQLAVSTVDHGRPSERYGLHFVSSPKNTLLPFANRQLFELTGKAGRSRRLASRLARHVNVVHWTQPEAQAASDDLLDTRITDAAVKILLQTIAPGFRSPQDGIFRVVKGLDALHVETNLDLADAERCYRRLSHDSGFGIATILVGIFEALADVRFAARFSSDFAVSSSTSAIAEIKLGRLLQQRQCNDERARLFQEWTFDGGRAIRDAVNNGHRNFDDILKLAASAERFKEWLLKQPDDVDVRKEYLQNVSRIDWVDRLPAKSFRWLLFSLASTALGFLTAPVTGILAGTALSAIDVFMFDRLAKGWKPNQFVEGHLEAFIRAHGDEMQ